MKQLYILTTIHSMQGAHMNKVMAIWLCILLAPEALAECSNENTEAKYVNADIIFTGKPLEIYLATSLYSDVHAKDQKKSVKLDNNESTNEATFTEFEPEVFFKKPDTYSDERISVYFAGGADSLVMSKQNRYLIFAKIITSYSYYLEDCNGSMIIDNTENTNNILRELTIYSESASAP